MGTHMRVLSESSPMNTNITRSDGFQKYFLSCAFHESSPIIGRVK